MYICISIYIYIYIYREREKDVYIYIERERKMYIYICIYICSIDDKPSVSNKTSEPPSSGGAGDPTPTAAPTFTDVRPLTV